MSLPPIAAAVTADAVAALPARLRARLDAAVEQARSWPVEHRGESVVVRVDDQTTLTLSVPVTEPGDAVCSCLLAPRCLHRAAVLSAAPVLTVAETAEPAPQAQATAQARDEKSVTDAQRTAAGALGEVAAALLTGGVPAAGAVAQADVLRAVHQARADRLHAAAAAAIRVVEQLRSARRDDPGFRLADLTADVRELLVTCRRVASGDATALGVARRDYEPVGDLRLHGVFCEPVRAATGHVGAVTYLADAEGRVWTVSDVKPGDPAQAASATRASVDLGEVRLSHHDLARGGLRAINAHASAAGRLSHGRARQAVAASGTGWHDEPVAALWRVPVPEQADRWLAGADLPAAQRPAAHDLAFLDGVVLGADRRGLLLALDDGLVIAAGAPHEDPGLPFVANLRRLATHATGHPVRLAGRFTGPRRVHALALAAPWLPERHGGHVDLGAVHLTRADLPGALSAAAFPAVDPPAAPLHLVRHQLQRVVSGGRAALLSGVTGDARRLADAHLSGAAAVVAALGAAGVRRTRDVFGRMDPHDAQVLARAWLAAAVYEQAAAREVTRAAWLG